jgi:hypothetical protein
LLRRGGKNNDNDNNDDNDDDNNGGAAGPRAFKAVNRPSGGAFAERSGPHIINLEKDDLPPRRSLKISIRLSGSGPSSGPAREEPNDLPLRATAAFHPDRGCLLGGAKKPGATGGKQKRTGKAPAGGDGDNDDTDDGNGDNDDDEDEEEQEGDNDVAGGGSERRPAKKTAHTWSSSRIS